MEGETVGGRFVVERKVGTGAMGSVYRALDQVSGHPVAMKILLGPGEHAERFARETSAIAKIDHPAAVKYVAHGVLPTGEPWLAMQWIEGVTLHKRLQRGKLGVRETLALARRIAAALGAAHAKNLVHRDVKPGNVMLPDGVIEQAILVDFGLARHAAATEVTRTGMFVGTPGYIAPEQARGDKDLGPPADVFSLGAMIFKCITGRAPFPGDDLVSVLAKILFEPAPRVSDFVPEVPDALDDLVARMLAKSPADRPADGGAVDRELAAIVVTDEPVHPRRSSLPAAMTPGEQRLVSVIVALAEPPSEMGTRTASGRERVLPVVKEFGGTLETLANGAFVISLQGAGAAMEQVVLAMRCALRVEQALEEVPVVLSTGRGVVSGALPVGEAIDRAAALLAAEVQRRAAGAGRRGVRVDETTAGLVDARFEVTGDELGLFVARERQIGQAARELLGMVTPCVGRERELGGLLSTWEECEEQPVAAATLLVGEAGVGKSRVRYEFVRRVKERGDKVEVWSCRGDPMRAGSPFALARQIVLQAAGVHEGEPIATRQQKLRARVARNVPADQVARVSAFLGEMAGTPFPDDQDVQLRTARRDPVLLGDLVQAAWEAFFAAECAANPVLVTIEDLQWGDLPTVKLLDGTLRALHGAPLMVLALGRPEVHDAFPRIWAGRPMTLVRLGAISKKAAEKLVRHVLADRVTAPMVARVVDLAGGNVFYLEELIRSVATGQENALPETVLAMVHARIGALEPEARQVLRAASVFGYVFWEAGVRSLLDAAVAPRVEAWLEALHEREIVSRRPDGRFPQTREFIFRNELVREAVYATLTPADSATGHRLAGAWLERSGEGDARVLAAHYERSGSASLAVRWYLRAAEQAMGGNDLEGAIECANHGVACGAVGEELGVLLTYLGTIAWWRGDSTIAVAQLEKALASLLEGSTAWCHAAGQLAASLGRMHKVAELRALADRVEAAAQRALTAGTAIAVAQTSVAFTHAGDPAAAASLLALLESRGDSTVFAEPLVAARASTARAMVALLAGDTGATIEWMTETINQFEALGDRRNATAQRVNLGYACVEVGLYEQAEAALREVLVVADRMGLDSVSSAAKQNLGLALTHLGKHEEARQVEEDSVEAFRLQKRPRMEDGSNIYLAHILARGGHLDEALAITTRICARDDLSPTFRAYALAMAAHVRLLRDENVDALEAARAAHEQLDALKSVDEGESLIRLVWAEALYANGLEGEARQAIVEAEQRVRSRAARMTNSAIREAFLTQVPENALTIELASAWTS